MKKYGFSVSNPWFMRYVALLVFFLIISSVHICRFEESSSVPCVSNSIGEGIIEEEEEEEVEEESNKKRMKEDDQEVLSLLFLL